MSQPDVRVTVEGGVAGVHEDHESLWTDENGDRCVRYVVTHDNEPPTDQQKTAEQSSTPSFGG